MMLANQVCSLCGVAECDDDDNDDHDDDHVPIHNDRVGERPYQVISTRG